MKIFKLAGTVPALALMGLLAMPTGADAAPVTPNFQTFGDLNVPAQADVTFGGDGIPTDPSAFTNLQGNNGDTLTLGITAHQRFANPPLGNDGAGTFTAQAGANDGTPGNPGTQSTWNFAWFAELVPGAGSTSTLSDYEVTLFYDLDPGVSTDKSNLGKWDLGTTLANSEELFGFQLPETLFQTSQNATFGFLATDDATVGVTAPSFTAFDPFAVGEYSFALGSTLGEVAINVNVNPIPLPAAGWLLLTAFGGLGLAARRRRKAA